MSQLIEQTASNALKLLGRILKYSSESIKRKLRLSLFYQSRNGSLTCPGKPVSNKSVTGRLISVAKSPTVIKKRFLGIRKPSLDCGGPRMRF